MVVALVADKTVCNANEDDDDDDDVTPFWQLNEPPMAEMDGYKT
jgi:hypothetical protein